MSASEKVPKIRDVSVLERRVTRIEDLSGLERKSMTSLPEVPITYNAILRESSGQGRSVALAVLPRSIDSTTSVTVNVSDRELANGGVPLSVAVTVIS